MKRTGGQAASGTLLGSPILEKMGWPVMSHVRVGGPTVPIDSWLRPVLAPGLLYFLHVAASSLKKVEGAPSLGLALTFPGPGFLVFATPITSRVIEGGEKNSARLDSWSRK